MPISTLDRPDILNVLFHPRHIFGPAYSTPRIRLIDIEVEPGITLGGRVYPAENTSPVILYFHGNGEIAADYDDIVPLYTQLGITLMVMDYRGYGRSTGTPRASTLLSDALAVYKSVDQALEENGLYPSKLYVMGRSLGSAAALEIAIHEELKFDGLIIESGFSDTFALLARIGGIQLPGADDQVDGFGNLSKVGRVSVPTLIIHGLKDVLIPSAEGVQLYENCAAEQKQLLLIPDAGHNDIMYVGRNQYMAAIQEFTTPNSAS
jgi:alpha-beta hydrolase superfamily lysophospholipase